MYTIAAINVAAVISIIFSFIKYRSSLRDNNDDELKEN